MKIRIILKLFYKVKVLLQIHLFKKGFVIFLKGATFSDFIETRLSNYKPLALGNAKIYRSYMIQIQTK